VYYCKIFVQFAYIGAPCTSVADIRNKSLQLFNYFHGIIARFYFYNPNPPEALPDSSSQQAMSTGQEDLRRNNEEHHLSQSQIVAPPTYYDANPALNLITELLNSNNYLSWSETVLLALGAKSLLNHITDSQNSSIETDPYYNQWIATNKFVRLWVLNSMEPSISRLFFSSKSALDL
jgi:gag-polypeptide of LTR copia-type